MTEKEIKEFVAEIRRKSEIFRNSGFATTGITNVFDKSADIIEELLPYMAIGTIDEFKALKEKNTPYKPKEYEDRYYACKCDNILLPKWRKYPTELMPKSEGLPHCMACGQKLDWQ